MAKIEWREFDNDITDDDIHKIELYFNISLPKDYINCVKEYNAGKPIPCIFNIIDEDGYVFNNLINIKKIIQYYQEYLGNLIPFAMDPAGNLICFDYSEGKTKSSKIIFWDHEEATDNQKAASKYICDTFSDFLNMLHDFEEDND